MSSVFLVVLYFKKAVGFPSGALGSVGGVRGGGGGPRERSPVTAPPRAPRAGATVDTGFLSEALVLMAGFRKLTWA